MSFPILVITDLDLVEMAKSYAASLDLGPRDVIVSRTGFPPLPRAPLGDERGDGRLPGNIRLTGARHPVFWLDRSTKLRRPGESDDHYVVRLVFEMLARGLYDAETAVYVDALHLAGLDADDDAVQDRLASYRAGGHDELLSAFVLERPSQVAPDWSDKRATEFCAHFDKAMEQLRLGLVELARESIGDVLASVPALMGELHAAIGRVAADAEVVAERSTLTGDDAELLYREARRVLDGSLTGFVNHAHEVDGAAHTIVLAMQASTIPEPELRAAAMNATERAASKRAAERQQRADVALASVYRREPTSVLVDELHSIAADLGQEVDETVAAWHDLLDAAADEDGGHRQLYVRGHDPKPVGPVLRDVFEGRPRFS